MRTLTRSQKIYSLIFALGLAALPLVANFMPRFLAFAPGLIALLGLAGFRPVFGRFPALNWKDYIAPLLCVLLIGASIFWAVDPDIAQTRTTKVFLVFLGGSLLYGLVKSLDADILQKSQIYFPLGVLLSGIVCAIEIYMDMPLYSALHQSAEADHDFNLSVLNRSVVFFLLCSVWAFAFVMQSPLWQHRARKAFLGALGVVMAVIMAATFSQSAQLALLLGVLIYAFFPYRHKKAWIALAIFIAVMLLTAPWLAQFLFKYLAPAAAQDGWLSEGFAADRMEIWDFVSRRALERPFFGHGVEATRSLVFDTALIYHSAPDVLHPHNFAIQLWIEFGAFGALSAAAFFAFLLKSLQKLDIAASRPALTGMVMSISVAATGYGFWQGWWIGSIAIMFALAALAAQLSKSQ